MKKLCATCRFFERSFKDIGLCRRHAPKPRREEGIFSAFWPITEETEWCGEWKAREGDPVTDINPHD